MVRSNINIGKIFFIVCSCIVFFTKSGFGQLAPAAQLLYDSAYAQDSSLVTFALSHGALVKATPDENSFYLQWFPTASPPNTQPVVVTLHGSHGNAFMEFKSWFPRANLYGCGIIALQWYRYKPNPPLDYFPDDTLYSYIDSALTRINYPSNKALLHGFSRGAARSFSLIFKDIQSGNNFFCTTISNSGDADTSYPLYDSITNGYYGSSVFAGKHWNLFCGGMDTIVGCLKMANTQTWLQTQGAMVDIFIQAPSLDHDGFQLPASSTYKDSILDNYIQCYNGTLSFEESSIKNTISIVPNPFSQQAVLLTENILHNASLNVYNSLGQSVKQIKNIWDHIITLPRDNLPRGLYFVRLTQDKQIITTEKILID